MKLSFYENLRNYYHNNHYIGDSFHDHDHFLVLIHVHEFGMILHSLQGMVQIQLDETSDFSSKAHLFCLATRRHDINSEYFVNLRSWYAIKHIQGMKCSKVLFFFCDFFLYTTLIDS